MNFSIHLPDPLVEDLDAFAQTRQTSRSGVIREAVRQYLARHALQPWPDLDRWMREPLPATTEQGPDFDAIRAEMNVAMRKRAAPEGQALMRYLLDTNIVSAWARKSSSALMLKLAQTPSAVLCVCTLVEPA